MKQSKTPIALKIFIFTFLLIPLITLAQPGCPSIYAGPDQTVPCNNTCTNLNATVLATGETSTYSVSSIPYAPPYPYNTGTPLSVGTDDLWSSAIAMPFTFCFYGVPYNQCVAGSNGVISFNMAYAGGYCPWSFAASIPNAALPLNSVFGPYHDIDPSVSGAMYYAMLGSYPCRTFVVNWNQVAMFDCTYLYATQQIVLYESTNVIEVYIQNKPLCTSWNNGNACIGIQNAGATLGLTPPGRNTGQWTASNEAWRFTPAGTPNYVIDWFEGGNSVGTGPSVLVCPSGNTTYTGQVTYTNCDGSQIIITDPVSVNVTNGINANITPSAPAFCGPGSVTLLANNTGSNPDYLWSTGDTTQSISVSPSVTTTYTVNIDDINGCTASAEVTVTINDLPIISVSPAAPAVCSGNPVQLTASSSTPGTNFTWNPGGAGNPITVSPVSTTTYTVSGTDGNGCTGTTSVTVNVGTNPGISVTPASPSICVGDSTLLTANSSNPGTNYTWIPGGIGNPITIGPPATTTYTVSGTDGNGCSGSATVTVTVVPDPNITVSPSNPAVCYGTPVVLTASGGNDYYWSPANGLSGTTGAIVTASPLISTIYTLIGVNLTGCADTISIPFTVIPPPLIDAGPDTVLCYGTSTQLQGSGGLIYQWTPTYALSDPNIPNPIANPTVTTTYYLSSYAANASVLVNGDFEQGNIGFSSSYTYSPVINNEGYYYITNDPFAWHSGFSPCVDHTSGTGNMMVINGTPVPNTDIWCQTVFVTPNTDYAFSCWLASLHVTFPAVLQFSINGILLGSTFNASPLTCQWDQFYSVWNSGASTSATICIVNQNISLAGNDFALDDISFSPLCQGLDTVVLSVSNLQVSSTSTDVACFSGNDGTATVTPSTGIQPYTYLWNSVPTQNTQTASGLTAGTYIVAITDSAGCMAWDTVNITEPPQLTGDITDTTVVSCFGGSDGTATLLAGGGTPIYSYLWDNGNTGTTAAGLSAGPHSVIITDDNNCPLVLNFIITQESQIILNLDIDDEGCENSCDGQMIALVSGGVPPYTYIWCDGSTNDTSAALCAGDCSVSITDNKGCLASDSGTVGTNTFIGASGYSDPIMGISPALINFYFTGNGASSYLWDFGDGTTSTIPNPSHTYIAQGTYIVIITVNSGAPDFCEDIYTLTVEILEPSMVTIPNIFTPNGDGINDFFIAVSQGLSQESMVIYNRWGKKVFEWDVVAGAWDGRTDGGGAESSDGVYYYIFTAKGFDQKEYSFHGTVTLMK